MSKNPASSPQSPPSGSQVLFLEEEPFPQGTEHMLQLFQSPHTCNMEKEHPYFSSIFSSRLQILCVNKCIWVPEHGCKLQGFMSIDASTSPQSLPSGSQVRFRVAIPSPQDLEHPLQSLQSAQTESRRRRQKSDYFT